MIHNLRVASSFALLGAVLVGCFFGNSQQAESFELIGSCISLLIAKYYEFF